MIFSGVSGFGALLKSFLCIVCLANTKFRVLHFNLFQLEWRKDSIVSNGWTPAVTIRARGFSF